MPELFQHEAAGGRRDADDFGVKIPLVKDRFCLCFFAGLQDHQHAFLAFGQHDLVGGHAGFALRHGVEVHLNADAALVRHFDGGGGEAGCAHVLDRLDRVGRHQFEAGFDQQLLRERITDLNGRAIVFLAFGKLGRGHGRAVDAVAASLGADIQDRQAGQGAARVEDLVLIGEADGHRVDEDVAVIAFVELCLARDRRHTDAVAIAADAGDDAGDELARFRVAWVAEAQRVDQSDRASAHREHVAQDAADAGRGALVGLDVGRVIVALHLEDGGLAVADIDDAGILARALDDARALGRELRQVAAGGFVGAVFAPHHRIDAEFDEVGLAAEARDEALPLISLDAMFHAGTGVLLGGEMGENALFVGHRCALAALSASRKGRVARRGIIRPAGPSAAIRGSFRGWRNRGRNGALRRVVEFTGATPCETS